jgi:flavin-dependent dehydrogenase
VVKRARNGRRGAGAKRNAGSVNRSIEEETTMTIEPTLDLTLAARRRWDAIAVGAGPAGALAALCLARWGASVLLVDRAVFPRGKVCGSCLNLRALATLETAGLGGLIGRLGAVPLSGLRLGADRRGAFIPLPGGVVLSRAALDAALVQAAVRAGAHFLPRTMARLGGLRGMVREVALRRDGRTVETDARVVLAAGGLGGQLLAREAGLATVVEAGARIGAGAVAPRAPAWYSAGTIYMACGTGGYAGLVRLEDGRLDIAAALDPGVVKQAGGLGPAVAAILHETGWPPVPGLADLAWHGTPLLSRHAVRPASDHVFLLGDAAGYVEPFTGEGIAWALASGAAVAPLAHRACGGWDPGLAGAWCDLYVKTVGRRQWACRTVAAVLRRPALTRIMIGALARVPALALPVVGYLNRAQGDGVGSLWFRERIQGVAQAAASSG